MTSKPRLVVCQECGVEFVAKDWRENRQTLFCSRKCRDVAQSTKVTLVCRQCNQPFQRKAYMESCSQERGPFCGMDCYGLWQRENTQGESNPNYKHQSNARHGGEWERTRLVALERDGYKCAQCGSTNRLHVHHKTPWQDDQPNSHALDNMVTLCASCHRKQHPLPHGADGRFLSPSSMD